MSLLSQAKNNIATLRDQIRSGHFTKMTSGFAPGLVQGNVVILSKDYAEDFLAFCRANPKPCPVIGVSEVGSPFLPTLGTDIDIRIDVPEYYIFENGKHTQTSNNLNTHWINDLVAVVLGCSFSFEEALRSEGFTIRNVEQGLNVSMFDTNISLTETQYFSGNMVVSMRPFKESEISTIKKITAQFPKAHGAPIHVGDPSVIGIDDIRSPDYGDSISIANDEIPVFWACGVTSQEALKHAKLPLAITHAPGKMLITDKTYHELSSNYLNNKD